MSKPINTAFAPHPPLPTGLRDVAIRWSADAALPTWQPGRRDVPSTVSVRFANVEAAR